MTLVGLLPYISPSEYWFDGACYVASKPKQARPLTVSCSFFNDDPSLVVEGTYRHQAGTTSHPFSIRLTPRGESAVLVEVNSSHTGELSGHMFEASVGFALLVSSAKGSAVACQIEVAKSGSIHATGIVNLGKSSFAFVANGTPGPERGTLGNVVGILGGRRA